MDMKEFSKYLKTVSFDKALHQARELSRERVIANEREFETIRHGTSQAQPGEIKETATA